jgi:hypothetical protein
MAGAFRAYRLCDLVPDAWFTSDFYRTVYRSTGWATPSTFRCR